MSVTSSEYFLFELLVVSLVRSGGSIVVPLKGKCGCGEDGPPCGSQRVEVSRYDTEASVSPLLI
jgi:hypothetical protein